MGVGAGSQVAAAAGAAGEVSARAKAARGADRRNRGNVASELLFGKRAFSLLFQVVGLILRNFSKSRGGEIAEVAEGGGGFCSATIKVRWECA